MKRPSSDYPTSILLGTAFLLLSCFVCIGQTEPPKNEPTQQKSSEIAFTAIDKENNFVGDIKKEELVLLIDGKEQSVSSVELVSSPTLYVLAVDNSGSLRMIFGTLMSAAISIVDENKDEDLTALMRFVGKDNIRTTQNFSKNRTYLKSQLNNFYIEGGQTAVIDAVFQSVKMANEQTGVPVNYQRAVIVISDGEDRDSSNTEKQLLELIKGSSVSVFFVGLINELSNERGFVSVSPRTKAKAFIEKVTQESGGVAIFPKKIDDLPQAARQISALVRGRYVMKFVPAAKSNPDAKIEIRLAKDTKRKDIRIYSRSYLGK